MRIVKQTPKYKPTALGQIGNGGLFRFALSKRGHDPDSIFMVVDRTLHCAPNMKGMNKQLAGKDIVIFVNIENGYLYSEPASTAAIRVQGGLMLDPPQESQEECGDDEPEEDHE